jgi:hypothetical protein
VLQINGLGKLTEALAGSHMRRRWADLAALSAGVLLGAVANFLSALD